MNAVMVKGNHVGSTMYYGPGAGAGPTASAVVADIIDVIRARHQPTADRVPALGFMGNQLQSAPVVNIDTIESAYYVRCTVQDHSGVLAKITAVFAEFDISTEHVHQEPSSEHADQAWLAVITDVVLEAKFNQALTKLQNLEEMSGEIMRIRIAAMD
jgi:homoserine dehydrogenase